VILPFLGMVPVLHETVLIAPGATVIGGVTIGENSSVWPGCVLRADINTITIGERTNIQDGAIIHVAHERPTVIGDDVTIGHGAIIHACSIHDRCLIGMGAIVLDGAEIPADTMLGAGSLIAPGKTFPSGMLVLGSPARPIRPLTETELATLLRSSQGYADLAREYRRTLASPSY
jgi:gamma-carbonic anhydrase